MGNVFFLICLINIVFSKTKQKNDFQGPVYIDYSIFSGRIRFGDFFCFFNLSSQVDDQRQGPVVIACRRAECRDSALVSTAFFMDLFGGYAESVALFFLTQFILLFLLFFKHVLVQFHALTELMFDYSHIFVFMYFDERIVKWTVINNVFLFLNKYFNEIASEECWDCAVFCSSLT